MKCKIVLWCEHWTPASSSTWPLAVGDDADLLRVAALDLAREKYADIPATLISEHVWKGSEGWAYLDPQMRRGISFRLIVAPLIGSDT